MAGILDTINAILRRSGLDPNAGARPSEAPPPEFTETQQQPGQLAPPAPAAGRPPLALPYRGDSRDDLERMENTRAQFEYDLAELFRIRGEAGSARAGATTTSARQRATDEYDAADAAVRNMQGAIAAQDQRIAAEKNRRRDEEKAEQAKEPKPKNGDTRDVPFDYKLPNGQTITGVRTEKYNNGAWSYVDGSAKPASGWAGQPQGTAQITNQVLTDGQGAYWTYDTATGKATAINGPAAGVKTVNDPDGSVWTQKPDGTKGQKLFDSLPGTYTTPDGRVVGYDKRSGQQVFSIDTQTAEGRALADRLQRATVEAAEQANLPKFGSAVAQYQSEASRRQTLARTELARLQELQKSGQISPDQAEAQFDRWMTLNVEGPLAGYKAAAEEERRKLEQENLTRQRAEEVRVETANRERDRLAFEAGEAGRREGITIGQRTRAPEFIADMGGLANSFSAGVGQPGAGASGLSQTPFRFSPGALDPANFRKAVPNLNELADAAVNRLLSRVQPATARDVNTPLPALPTGGDLRSIMDGVRYSGPLSAAPSGEQPLPGQAALDQGNGTARTVYSNGRYIDWPIEAGAPPAPTPAAAPVPQAAQAAPAAPTLPGSLPGETPEQRQARWASIMARSA